MPELATATSEEIRVPPSQENSPSLNGSAVLTAEEKQRLEQVKIRTEVDDAARLQKIREEFLPHEGESEEAYEARLTSDAQKRRDDAKKAKEQQRLEDLREAGILEQREGRVEQQIGEPSVPEDSITLEDEEKLNALKDEVMPLLEAIQVQQLTSNAQRKQYQADIAKIGRLVAENTATLQFALGTKQEYDWVLPMLSQGLLTTTGKVVKSLVAANIHNIVEKPVEGRSMDEMKAMNRLAYALLRGGNDDKRLSGLLLQNIERLAASNALIDRNSFSGIFEFGSEDQKEALEDFIIANLAGKIDTSLESIPGLLSRKFKPDMKDTQDRVVGERLVGKILDSYGLDRDEYFQAWINSANDETLHTAINANITALVKLENANPGIAKALTDRFGIRVFGRYPQEVLERQYEEMDNVDLPYGILLEAAGDWKGSNYRPFLRDVTSKVSAQLAENGFGLRIFEVRSKYDIARALITSDEQYSRGGKNKIGFALLHAHGNPKLMHFGGNVDRGVKRTYIYKSDMQGKGVRRTKDYFIPNPTIALLSCEVGQKDGLAQEMSELGAKVIGSEVKGNVSDIEVRVENGKVDLDVTYDNTGSFDAAYVQGAEMKKHPFEMIAGPIQKYFHNRKRRAR